MKDIVINENRQFEGVWIPKKLYITNKFTPREKFMLVEIKSLSQNGYCYAQDKHFADFIGVSERQVQKILSKLKDDGYIRTEYEYEENSKAIKRRYIFLTDMFYDEFINERGTELKFGTGTEPKFVDKYNNNTREQYTLSSDNGNIYTSPAEDGVHHVDSEQTKRHLDKIDKVAEEELSAEYVDDFKRIAKEFVERYFKRFGKPHKAISLAAYRRIVERYLTVPDTLHSDGIYEVDDYLLMIDEYFVQGWKQKIELSISHFFSDNVRGYLYERVCK